MLAVIQRKDSLLVDAMVDLARTSYFKQQKYLLTFCIRQHKLTPAWSLQGIMLLLLIILALSNPAWHFHQPLYQNPFKLPLNLTVFFFLLFTSIKTKNNNDELSECHYVVCVSVALREQGKVKWYQCQVWTDGWNVIQKKFHIAVS